MPYLFLVVNFFLTKFTYVNIITSRTPGKAGNTGHVPEYHKPPRWTFPTSTELGKPQAFGSGKARDGREGETRQRPGECPGKTRGKTARGASVSRRAGQHDDAEKAGTTPGDAKAGKAAGPIPFSDFRRSSRTWVTGMEPENILQRGKNEPDKPGRGFFSTTAWEVSTLALNCA